VVVTKAYIMDFAGGTAEQYHAVVADMHLDDRMPAGAMFHYAGPGPDGLRVTDAWTDPDAFDRFAAEQIGPLGAKHGLVEPRIEIIDVAMEHTGELRRPELVQVVRLPGVTRERFLAAHARILEDGRWPEPVVHHVNGPYDGGWCVIDSWTSKAARDAFLEARVMPQRDFMELTGPPDIADLMVFGMLLEPAGAPA
jgi:hypothetical protein